MIIPEVVQTATKVSYYIDVGFGSLLIQFLIAVLIGAPIYIRLFCKNLWEKIKHAVNRK